MAKSTNTSLVWLGNKYNTRQMQLAIPAGPGAEDSGLLFLESTSGTTQASKGGVYLWADSGNSLRFSSTRPTTEDSDGSVLGVATSSQASRSLNNLQTTTINASLISDTNNTDALGSSSIYWASAYTGILYLSSTAYFTGSANTATLTGDLALSAGNITVVSDDGSVNGLVVSRNDATTSAPLVQFNCDHADEDDSVLELLQDGTGNVICLEIMHDGDYAAIDIQAGAAREGKIINIVMANQEAEEALYISGEITSATGEGTIHIDSGTGNLAATSNLLLIESSGTHETDSRMVELNYDTGTIAGASDGFILSINDSSGAQATSYAVEITSDSNEALHVDKGLVVFDETLTMTGGADIAIAEGKITVDTTVNESSYFIRNQGTTTNPIVEIEATNTSDDTAALLIDSKSTVANVDVVVVETDGASYGITVNPAHATGAGYEFTAAADSTVPGILLDGLGTPGPWLGGDGVGMLQIQSDGTLAHAASSLLALIGTGGSAAASATGSMLRIVENSSGGSGYAVYIASTGSVEALHIDDGKVVFDETLTVGGAITATVGIQSTPVAVTANSTKASAAIASGTTNVIVTSTGATDFVELPTPVAGHVIWLFVAATGYELIANDSTTEYINGAVGAGADDASSSVAANTLVRCYAVDTTHWLASQFDTAGDITALESATS